MQRTMEYPSWQMNEEVNELQIIKEIEQALFFHPAFLFSESNLQHLSQLVRTLLHLNRNQKSKPAQFSFTPFGDEARSLKQMNPAEQALHQNLSVLKKTVLGVEDSIKPTQTRDIKRAARTFLFQALPTFNRNSGKVLPTRPDVDTDPEYTSGPVLRIEKADSNLPLSKAQVKVSA